VLASVVILLSVLANKLNSGQPRLQENTGDLSAAQDIYIEASSDLIAHVGEPFEYQVRVVYRPDKVAPDFRRLLRDVSFVPFEQRHKTRTGIVENKDSDDIHEYLLSYTIIGVDVIPGNEYHFDDITVRYIDLETDNPETLTITPSPVQINRYYNDNPLGIALQPVKGPVDDKTSIVFFLLIFCLLVFVLVSGALLKKVLLKPDVNPQSIAEQVLEQINEIRVSIHDRRSKLIEYEKLLLSLFKTYGNRTASGFWLSTFSGDGSLWSISGATIKPALENAYRASEPEAPELKRLEVEFEKLYKEIQQQAKEERSVIESQLQGTLGQRVKQNRFTVLVGSLAMIIGLLFLVLIVNQNIWMDLDGRVFNQWMNNLPQRLIAEDKQHELNNLDIEMLGHISDEHRVLENLQSDELRSAYLYNYGTLATNIYKSILLNPPEDEEEEAAEPPTFEFPLV
ncbi:MAG: hypothetical protein HKN08_12565, partial [Gammaproteobacteria bacterium]|nr:hypothetical protein [Gammaproteobacteria bacterium]